ncbi:MAG: hypothetical protein ACTS80_00955 [Candidatus Hodgkinia cicadicola]
MKGAAEAAEELRSMGNLDEIHLRPFGRLMRSKDPASLSWPIVTWRKFSFACLGRQRRPIGRNKHAADGILLTLRTQGNVYAPYCYHDRREFYFEVAFGG